METNKIAENNRKAIHLLDIDRLNLLMELTGQINSNLDLDSLLLDIINAAKVIMESEASSLLLLDEKTDDLVLSIPTGPMQDEITGVRFSKDKGIGGWVVANNETVMVEDVYNDPRFLGDFRPEQFKTRNLICVPLRNQNKKVIGALQAMNRHGDCSYAPEDATIFEALANQVAIAIENARLHEEHLQKQLLEQQMNLAHSIQAGFWPRQTPNIPGYRVAGISKPATWVGGDYYDFIRTNDEAIWGFTLGDVTGKGMAAALLMAELRSVLRAQIENNNSINESISRVNRTIFKDTPIDKFITLFYGELNTDTHWFRYVNAGHNPAYLINFDTGKIKKLRAGDVMLGIIEDVNYRLREVEIAPGEQLVIFSDGITEAQNSDGDFYGDEQFEQWLLQHPDYSPSDLISLILLELEMFRGSHPQSDDITMLIIKRDQQAD